MVMGVRQRLEHEGVEGLRSGRYRLGINSSCILYRVGDTLIDTGPPNQWRSVRRFVEERAVRQVVVTHHHEDHSGNGHRLQKSLGASVLAPRRALALLAGSYRLRLYQRVIWGSPGRYEAQPVPDDVLCDGGRRLRPVSTPGHSEDMTCYLEPDRGWLFSGDLYIASRPRYLRNDEDLEAYLRSLRAVLALDFGTLFCSHRGVIPDGPRAVRAKLDFLESLRAEARGLKAAGRSTREITEALLGREDLTTWITAHHLSKRNLIRACLADPRGATRQ
jgi:glyoxylase-like metal-dependent hydrolase (beta-lactamase superfamily II)